MDNKTQVGKQYLSKTDLRIRVGDVVKIDPRYEAYGQKSYIVLEVSDNVLTCQVDVKNIVGNRECTYYKEELSDEMISKFSHRNNQP